jgi:ubiquinone/menaquinone biosynthesis C-methylase UbiE
MTGRPLARVALVALLAAAGGREAPDRAPAGRVSATAAPAGVAADRFPSPDRPISGIVSPRWADEDSRDDAREADTVMTLLGVGPGTVVADIGAGDGYYTVRAARRVGAGGHVYAEDITPRYVELLRDRLDGGAAANVTVVLGEPHDPRLPAAAVDVALLVHMYHEIEQPYALLHNLAPALRPGARVGILDLDRRTDAHGTPPALLRCELERVGYRFTARHALGPGEYLAVFAPPERPAPTPEQISASVRAAPCAAR